MNSLKKIKVGIIGTGFMGVAHWEALRRIPNVEVVAISGSSENKARDKANELGIETYYDNYQDLLNDHSIDCVHICTPNYLHYEMCKEAILANKHVICEKPLTLKVEEAEELVQLVEERQLVHAICFNIRFYPLLHQIKESVRNKDLGEIYAIGGSYLQDWLFYETDYNWRVNSDLSGDSRAIADIGSHWMDLIESITDLKITEVFADFATFHTTRKKPLHNIQTFAGKIEEKQTDAAYKEIKVDTEDYATVLLRFSNGAKGNLTVSQVHAGRKNALSFEIAASKKAVSWNSEKPNELWFGHRDKSNEILLKDPSLVSPNSSKYMGYPGGHNEGYPDTFKQLFTEVYEAIAEGKMSDQTFPTFIDGLREQILCEKIVESNNKQQWIKI